MKLLIYYLTNNYSNFIASKAQFSSAHATVTHALACVHVKFLHFDSSHYGYPSWCSDFTTMGIRTISLFKWNPGGTLHKTSLCTIPRHFDIFIAIAIPNPIYET